MLASYNLSPSETSVIFTLRWKLHSSAISLNNYPFGPKLYYPTKSPDPNLAMSNNQSLINKIICLAKLSGYEFGKSVVLFPFCRSSACHDLQNILWLNTLGMGRYMNLPKEYTKILLPAPILSIHAAFSIPLRQYLSFILAPDRQRPFLPKANRL